MRFSSIVLLMGIGFCFQAIRSSEAQAFGNFNTHYIKEDLSGNAFKLSEGIEFDNRALPKGYLGEEEFSPLHMVLLLDPIQGRKRALQLAKVRDAIEIFIDEEFPKRQQKEAEFAAKKRQERLPPYSTKALATDIAVISDCLKIDPFVYTALIATESGFRRNIRSNTGASGLTQFVDIAVKEVSDQLGWRSEWFAREETIQYLNEEVLAKCIAPRLYPKTGWTHFWNREGTEARSVARDGRPKSRSDVAEWNLPAGKRMAREFAKDPKLALVYGAILLKEDLSVVRFSTSTGGCKPPRGFSKEIHPLYIRALMKYNGDDCKVKQSYAQKVLGLFFPKVFDIYKNQVLAD